MSENESSVHELAYIHGQTRWKITDQEGYLITWKSGLKHLVPDRTKCTHNRTDGRDQLIAPNGHMSAVFTAKRDILNTSGTQMKP